MSKKEIRVNLLSGVSALIKNNVTFKELRTRAAKGDKIDEKQLDIYVNGVVFDLNKYGTMKICDYSDENGDEIEEINIGRCIISGTKFGNVEQIDQKLVNDAMKEKTAPTPVLRGYTGHVPGRKYSYGVANSKANKEHQLPPEIAEKENNGIHYKPDITLGYKGFIRGQQHVAGRTYRHSLQKVMTTKSFNDLAQGSLLPTEPQHHSNRNFSLEDVRRHIKTL
eukprot:415235_1